MFIKNHKGRVAIEVLVVLVAIVITSAVILFLVQSGIIAVKGQSFPEPILNAEFIPIQRDGFLAIKEFQFCGLVDDNYLCLEPSESFPRGAEVHFRFVVESTVQHGEVLMVENYKIKGPDGSIILDVDAKNNFNFDSKSQRKTEEITFKDYFVTTLQLPAGEYSLELLLANPLLDKKTRTVKKFELK